MKRHRWILLVLVMVLCFAISWKYDPPPVAAEQVLYKR